MLPGARVGAFTYKYVMCLKGRNTYQLLSLPMRPLLGVELKADGHEVGNQPGNLCAGRML